MAVFQVSSRRIQNAVPPRKRRARIPYQREIITHIIVAGVIGGTVITLLIRSFPNTIFFLLPVLVGLTWAQPQRYNVGKFLKGTPIYFLLTICLMLIYYGMITEGLLLLHPDLNYPHIIIIATALAWTIMLDPVRGYGQSLIERRFNVRDRSANEIIKAFTKTLRDEIDLDQLCERFLTVVQQTMQPYTVSLWIRSSDKRQEQSGSSEEEVLIADDDPLVAYMRGHTGTLEIDQLQIDSPVLQDLKLRATEITLPLTNQGELIGLLMLGAHAKGDAYTREERTLLDTLATQVAPALRVAQMVQEQKAQVRQNERIEQELRTAQTIQHTFLPKDVPAPVGWELLPYYRPAHEVGGDFYDFIPFEDGRLGIVIGDVTDKGVPAALVMATTHTMLRGAVQASASPGEILARVNELLCVEIPAKMFVTCFFALLDPKSGRLCYANAGHEPPYRRHDGSVTELWATGMPLGLMSGMCYEEQEVTLAPGESLLFYSDGLVEAHNVQREMLGFPRLSALIAEHTGPGLIDFLLNELATFTGTDWEQEDDVTLVVLQREL